MKLIDASNAQLIDDINKLLEPVICIARHPKEDVIAYGGELGGVRIYKMKDNQERTAANRDINLVREFEKQPATVHAVCYSPDGGMLAVAGAMPEIRVYNATNGTRLTTCKIDKGATFALATNSKDNLLAAGGFDGSIRYFDWKTGELKKTFTPFPIKAKAVATR
jgi:WD40 repeat protein